jgi:hypothetical protein
LPYSFLNLLHLLGHGLSLLLEHGEFVSFGQWLGRLLRHCNRFLDKATAHPAATALSHALALPHAATRSAPPTSTHSSASALALPHAATSTHSAAATSTHTAAHSTSHAHCSFHHRGLL